MSSLNDLPEVSYADSNVENMENSIIEGYEALSGRILFPGDPIRLFLESLALVIVQQKSLINVTSKQNLLKYAKKEALDNLGAFTRTKRLQSQRAVTVLKFTISDIQQSVITIPSGTKSTAGDGIYFETTEAYEIIPGQTTITLSGYCTEPGSIGNGYGINTIKNIVDVFPYFKEVTNITASSGGTDIELDDNYRERIHLAPEGFSTAGPELGYKYYALSADSEIIDAETYSPSEGKVNIVILTKTETPELLEKVASVCNARDKRPLTDLVTIMYPTKVNYDINLQYWIDKANQAIAGDINMKVIESIEEYVQWQNIKLGRNINPSKLIQSIMAAGASRVEIISPTYTNIANTEIANIVTKTITYGGVEID